MGVPGTLCAVPVLAISPHLDDAALGCGCLLARLAKRGKVRVVTVFAALPPDGDGLSAWDCAGGFRSSREAVRTRREEDRRALALLGVRARWLRFLDSQYGKSPSVAAVAHILAALCRGARTVLFPLGLFHSDHRLVHEAMLRVMRRRAGCAVRWIAYEDALYRRLPGLTDGAVGRLRRLGFAPRRLRLHAGAAAGGRKAQAVACYLSQLRALATPGRLGHGDTANREGYWALGGRCRPAGGR